MISVSGIFIRAASAGVILALFGHLSAKASSGDAFAPDECPKDALQLGTEAAIDWKKIGSDAEAIACVRQLGAALGPTATRERLLEIGFNAVFIDQFGPRREVILLSASWPIHTKGKLHSSGAFFNDLSIGFFAYGETFAIMWEPNGNTTVSNSYTFK